MKIDRNALSGMFLAGAMAMSAPQEAHGQTASSSYTHFEPDARTVIGGRTVEIDIALLGPNGEETVGFYASLDPFHGRPFNEGWYIMYGHLIGSNPRDTNPRRIEHILTHMRAHGIKVEELKAAYQTARRAWNHHPALRANEP